MDILTIISILLSGVSFGLALGGVISLIHLR